MRCRYVGRVGDEVTAGMLGKVEMCRVIAWVYCYYEKTNE